MTPAIADGDTLVVETTDSESFRPGQIVAFWHSRTQLVAHRVCWVDRRHRRLFTMGDAVAFPDRPTPFEAVLGVVTAVIAPDGSSRQACLLCPPWRRGWRWLARRLAILLGREGAPSRVLRRLGLPAARHRSEVVRYERVAGAVPSEPGGDRQQP